MYVPSHPFRKDNLLTITTVGLMDGKQFHEVKGSDVNLDEWKILAHQKYYPVLNVAVGSNFPGNRRPSDKTITGIEGGMLVNYVAFYVSD